jgi:hypothetical protein
MRSCTCAERAAGAEQRVITLASLSRRTFRRRLLQPPDDAVWSRWACCRVGAPETLWQPSLASSGKA